MEVASVPRALLDGANPDTSLPEPLKMGTVPFSAGGCPHFRRCMAPSPCALNLEVEAFHEASPPSHLYPILRNGGEKMSKVPDCSQI